jgi:hypothetical protein
MDVDKKLSFVVNLLKLIIAMVLVKCCKYSPDLKTKPYETPFYSRMLLPLSTSHPSNISKNLDLVLC